MRGLLLFTPHSLRLQSSLLFGSMPADVVNVRHFSNALFVIRVSSSVLSLQIFQSQNVTMNNHQMGVTPADFAAAPSLASRFTVLSTNLDRVGKRFVSSIEGKTLPIYAAQVSVGGRWCLCLLAISGTLSLRHP